MAGESVKNGGRLW